MDRTRYVACPLCEADPGSEICVADTSRHALYKPPLPPRQVWLECGKCGHVYTEGYFDDEAFKHLIENTHPGQSPGFEYEQRRFVWAHTLEAAQAFVSRGRWLDVGFGDGSLLTTADEFGYEAVGLDLRESNVKQLNEWGIKAHVVDIEGYRDNTPFQVVSMMDVLEHMPFPRSAIVRAHQLLDENGLLIVSMPNMDSFVWKQRPTVMTNPYWNEIEHYHNFGRRRLYSLLTELGFNPVRYRVSTRYKMGMEVFATKVS